jgi:hypothetical protein
MLASLGDDTLAAELASVGEGDFAVAVKMFAIADAVWRVCD